MTYVYLRDSSYQIETLKPAVFELLDLLNPGLIQHGSKVLIKPNLLAPASPEKAMVTHPLIIRAAVEYVLEKGALPQISDSPAMGTFDRVIKESGMLDALKGLPVVIKPFKESVRVYVGGPFRSIEIAKDVIDSDMVINIAKLKTHTQMLLTLCVKNMFGCIVGMRKPEWHFRTGIDREKFAELLVRIWAAVRPQINILDGILAMEGQGPGKSGVPREIGLIMAADDGLSVDRSVCCILGISEDDLLTVKIAKMLGYGTEPVRIDGRIPYVKDFKMPSITPVVFGPKPLHPFMRRHLVQRPACKSSLCRHCGECWKYCPAKAISAESKGLKFNYDRCIRCYCCIEVCPYGALFAEETTAGKFARKLFIN